VALKKRGKMKKLGSKPMFSDVAKLVNDIEEKKNDDASSPDNVTRKEETHDEF
jgi:hypothetical protein